MLGVLNQFAAWAPLGLPSYLFLITVVVFFHELGHFSVARACGIRVETFSIGFGPAIFGWNDKHGTRWKVSWIPFGGYVKFFGDSDAASTPDRDAASRMSPEDRAVAFPFKPLYQRAMVVAAGPFANFILAIAVFTVLLLAFGRSFEPPVVGSVYPGSAADVAGIRAGDVVQSINGKKIETFEDLPAIISFSAGQDLAITFTRNGRAQTVHATPRLMTVRDQLGDMERTIALGISQDVVPVANEVAPNSIASRAGFQAGDVIRKANGQVITGFSQFADIVSKNRGRTLNLSVLRGGKNFSLKLPAAADPKYIVSRTSRRTDVLGIRSAPYAKSYVVRYGPIAALGTSVAMTWLVIKGTVLTIWQMAVGYSDMSQIHGPIGVAGVAGKVATLGLFALIQLAALMSVSIGLINLFPIPLLDGGHLLYYGCEAVLGRPLGERAQDFGFRLGLAVVLGLMILVTWNDLARLNLF